MKPKSPPRHTKIILNARFLAEPYSGIGIYTKNLIQTLAKLDHENEYHIVCHKEQKDTSLRNFTFPKNFHFHLLPEIKRGSKSIKKSTWEIIQLPRFAKKLGVDIVHSTYPNLSSYKSLLSSIFHIVTVHDIIPWILPDYTQNILSKLYHRVSKRRSKKADHILTVSDFSKNEIQKFLKIPEHKITVAHNAVDTDFRKDLEIKNLKFKIPHKRYIVYVGGFDRRKNLSQLVDVFSAHIAPHYEIDLVIVGDKLHSNSLYQDGAEKNLENTKGEIVRTGFVTEEEKKELFKNALAFIHLSLYEGFNIPLLEAMHTGTPALVSDIPPHREVAQDAAVFLDVTDEKHMAATLKQFLENAEKQKELGEKGKKRAENFSWEKNARIVLNLYNNIRPHKKS